MGVCNSVIRLLSRAPHRPASFLRFARHCFSACVVAASGDLFRFSYFGSYPTLNMSTVLERDKIQDWARALFGGCQGNGFI